MKRLLALVIFIFALVSGYYFFIRESSSPLSQQNVNRIVVLSYSSFVNSWGPGPEIVKAFTEKTGIEVDLQDAGDAGLILKKLAFTKADAVIGLDQLSLYEARKSLQWKEVPSQKLRWEEKEFLPFDWGPLAFVYRTGEATPPKNLDDLLQPRYAKQITLQDPRTSTIGLQFLYWVLAEKGVEEGFKFLEKLKPSLHSVSNSWSTAYGVFQKKQAQLAFSYLTSPVYHWTVDKEEQYQAAIFESGHAIQVEYAAIPDNCEACVEAQTFLLYLLDPKVQKLIMEKNFMFPIVAGVEKDTPFARLPPVKAIDLRHQTELHEKQKDLLERWKQVGL